MDANMLYYFCQINKVELEMRRMTLGWFTVLIAMSLFIVFTIFIGGGYFPTEKGPSLLEWISGLVIGTSLLMLFLWAWLVLGGGSEYSDPETE